MLARLEAPGDRDYIGRLTRLFRSASRAPQEHIPRLLDRIQPRMWKLRFPLLPQVVDTYLLSSFLFYFVLWLVSFVAVVPVGLLLAHHERLSLRKVAKETEAAEEAPAAKVRG